MTETTRNLGHTRQPIGPLDPGEYGTKMIKTSSSQDPLRHLVQVKIT